MLCIAALVLLLPHNLVSKSGKSGSQPYNTTNIINPVTTIAPSTTIRVSTTTVTPQNGSSNQTFNYTQYVQQLSNKYSTTTILYVYCVGSPVPSFNQSYYSTLDPSGAESWKSTTDYPIPFLEGSCASSGGYVYCLGDSEILFSSRSTEAFYAPISSKGIGAWQQTTSYPVQFNSGSCAAYNNYIYCVGTFNSLSSNKVFYAPISSKGIGAWQQTTSYPSQFYGGQCSTLNGYIYCIGDTYLNASAFATKNPADAANIPINKSATSTSAEDQALASLATSFLGGISYDYYAPVTPSGVGQWKRINPTPQPVDGGSCTISNSTIYCIAGSSAFQSAALIASSYSTINSATNVTKLLASLSSGDSSASFYSRIAANGSVGNWIYTASYPNTLQGAQCTANGANIYCIGDSAGNNQQQVYYSKLASGGGIASWTQTTNYPIPFYSGYCSTSSGA